jgi:hypothetical protein
VYSFAIHAIVPIGSLLAAALPDLSLAAPLIRAECTGTNKENQ